MAPQQTVPELEEFYALPSRQGEVPEGATLLYRAWVCWEAGDKTNGRVSNKCLRFKKRPPADVQRPTCKRHRQATMHRLGRVYRLADGTLVRFSL